MALRCNCGIPSKVLRSWTNDNPGRRFATCKFSDAHRNLNGCGFFQWLDADIVEWQRVTTNELLLEKRLLQHEVAFLRAEVRKLEDEKCKNEAEMKKLKKVTEKGKKKQTGGVHRPITALLCGWKVLIVLVTAIIVICWSLFSM